jgi:hypothetical protein
MRVFRKDIAVAHENRISSGFSFTTTLTLNMMLEDHFVRYVPIAYQRRVGKSKVKIGMDTLRMARIVVQALLYYDPFKIFLPLCALSLLAGGILAWVVGTSNAVAGWLLLGVTLLCCFVLGAMGMLAEAVRLHRVTQVVGRRPE